MNPFKNKQLKDFTIADCELYISKYPYGEHCHEVKKHLRELKKTNSDNKQEEPNTENQVLKEQKKHTKKIEQPAEEINKEPEPKTSLSERIVLWVIEIIVLISFYLIIVFRVLNPVCEFIVELIGVNLKNNSALMYQFSRLVGLGIIFPIHNFFKSLRE